MSIEYKVDYHIHSYYSDGTMSPVELVRKYHDDEYNIISITDHDGIDGVKEALTAGEALLMQVVTGVEFSTEHNGCEMHLLGYKFDPDNEALNKKLAELKAERRERNQRLVNKLCEMGYELSMEELEKRLRSRGTDSERKIEARLIRAREEYEAATFYDYIIVNDDADKAAKEFSAIITAEYCKYDLRKNFLSEV